MKTSFVETSHGKLAVAESAGRGPDVLLIHGNSACKEVFRNQLEGDVGREFHVVAFDLPGHGASENAPDPAQTYAMTGYADAARQLLKAMDVSSVAVLGWSLGGHIGLEMAAQSLPIRGLLITGTPPVGKNETDLGAAFLATEEMGLTSKEHFTDADAEAYARGQSNASGPVDPMLLAAMKRTDGRARRMMFEAFAAGRGADQRAVAETAKLPLAVVSGAEEHFVNNAYLSRFPYGNLWERTVFIVQGAGHAPFWEAPSTFNAIFLRFLRSLES